MIQNLFLYKSFFWIQNIHRMPKLSLDQLVQQYSQDSVPTSFASSKNKNRKQHKDTSNHFNNRSFGQSNQVRTLDGQLGYFKPSFLQDPWSDL